MAKTARTRGLCSTCTNAAGCTHRQQAKFPVLRCEEFGSYQPPRTRAAGQVAVSAGPPLGSNPGGRDSGRYRGLCQDCEDRVACTFPRPEGGVWRCEEYR